MRHTLVFVLLISIAGSVSAETPFVCSCGADPPSPPAKRSLAPYAGVPDDMRPFVKIDKPYQESYTDLVEYNGSARELPDADAKTLKEIRIGFIGPLENHPDAVLGKHMLQGAQLAIDQANAVGGYGGRPFRLMLHNDSAIWGASSNEVVKMVYDDKVWAIFGSISSDTTHIALRVALKAEVPVVNSASTDPTIPETVIPWYFTVIQDDRMQGYTLARRIYDELGLKRIAILRVDDRYGRVGVLKFREAAQQLRNPVVSEQKFAPATTDFRQQLKAIADLHADGIVLWADQEPAAAIVKQMHELGMTQHVFGSHRIMGDEFVQRAGVAAEGVEAVSPFDPSCQDRMWMDFEAAFEKAFHERPDQFAALAYDQIQVLLQAICRAGLNRGRIRDALTSVEDYRGVTGEMVFDPNCKNISPLFLATVRGGRIEYRRLPMTKPYARVNDEPAQYHGPSLPDMDCQKLHIAVFGPAIVERISSTEVLAALAQAKAAGLKLTLVPVASDVQWGKASSQLVDVLYQQHAMAVITLDRASSHLAEQLALKVFVPVLAISADHTLASTNVPWIFRLPQNSSLQQAIECLTQAIRKAGPNPEKVRDLLASGAKLGDVSFLPGGEPKQ